MGEDEAWEDAYIVIYYMDGELTYKTFTYNREAAEFLEELTRVEIDFDPRIHALVIKTEAERYGILSVDTERILKISIGNY